MVCIMQKRKEEFEELKRKIMRVVDPRCKVCQAFMRLPESEKEALAGILAQIILSGESLTKAAERIKKILGLDFTWASLRRHLIHTGVWRKRKKPRPKLSAGIKALVDYIKFLLDVLEHIVCYDILYYVDKIKEDETLTPEEKQRILRLFRFLWKRHKERYGWEWTEEDERMFTL